MPSDRAELPADVLTVLRERYPRMAEKDREATAKLVAAIREANGMAAIAQALDISTGVGDIWPQSPDYPNPGAALMFAALLKRDPVQARIAWGDGPTDAE